MRETWNWTLTFCVRDHVGQHVEDDEPLARVLGFVRCLHRGQVGSQQGPKPEATKGHPTQKGHPGSGWGPTEGHQHCSTRCSSPDQFSWDWSSVQGKLLMLLLLLFLLLLKSSSTYFINTSYFYLIKKELLNFRYVAYRENLIRNKDY